MKAMKAIKTFASSILVGGLMVSAGFAQTFGPLVEPTTLAAYLAAQPTATDVVVLDIGNNYAQEHIDGAVSAPYSLFRGPKENPGQLVDIAGLEADLERIGVKQDDTIVVVPEGKTSTDFGAAARVYWTLKSTGFTDLSILNGGHSAWASAGLDVSNTATTLVPSELSLTFDTTWLATTEDVSAVVDGSNRAVLVDARLRPFYEGEKAHPAAARPGTLPGAINHAFTYFFQGDDAAISPVTDSSALLATLNLDDGDEVISFCNTGHWAASHWFAVSELAGVKNARLYAGSMVEYSNADLPMENTPGLWDNLLRQIAG